LRVRVEELLERRAQLDPRHTAVVCSAARYSYAELNSRATAFAETLATGGLRPGDRVAIQLDNSIDTIVALFGVLKARGVFFILSPQSPDAYIARLLADSAASAVVSRDGSGPMQVTWRKPHENAIGPIPAPDPDLAALVYTSGSTGEPKGVMLTHGNLMSAAVSIAT
jgi:acyl-CoA synthetase (AMP-forming)/AMP-acid ligase II